MKARIKNCLKKIKIGGYKLKDTLPPYFSGGFLLISLILTVNLLILTANYPSCSNKILSNPIAKADAATTTEAIAENVIVLIIDGLRNDEAFDDPTHQYIPHIWNDLKPQGVINANFWNTGITVTTAAHTQIVSGVRPLFNNQGNGVKFVSKYPNIFEYYRKEKSIAKDKVWFIAGKGSITGSIDRSLHPDYANLPASKESLDQPDNQTWASVQQKMDIYHPSLMVVNLRDVDHYGHEIPELGYSAYTSKIIAADQIAYDLWQKIQNDPYYKDKTDLIITTDHGRDTNGYLEGAVSHGSRNHGDRHIMFLAIGPDFKQNEVVNIKRDHVDIAPTVGAILDFQTPYADGAVMSELFNDQNLGSNIATGGQRRLNMSASSSGVHTVWSEKSNQEWDIYYKKSTDGGTIWSAPTKLFETGVNNNYFYEAEVTSQGDMVYAAAIGYSLINEGGDTYTWKVFGRRSLDGGNTWGDIQELKDAGLVIVNPAIASSNNNILITYSSKFGKDPTTMKSISSIRGLYSANQGISFSDYLITDTEGVQIPIHSSITCDQNRFYVTWSNQRSDAANTYWNVFFDKSYMSPISWGIDKLFTGNTSDGKLSFLDNSITINNSGLIKLLITKRKDTAGTDGSILAGKWKTIIKSSSDYGNTFADGGSFYDSVNYEAWNPEVSFINPTGKDFTILWEQHQNNSNGEIYSRKKVGSAWQDITPLSALDGKDSAEPVLATYNNNAYVGWQDYENGNWRIEIKKIN